VTTSFVAVCDVTASGPDDPSVTVAVPPLRFVPLIVSEVDVDDELAIVGTAACAGVATSDSEPRASENAIDSLVLRSITTSIWQLRLDG
jgi:hypothetical protein